MYGVPGRPSFHGSLQELLYPETPISAGPVFGEQAKATDLISSNQADSAPVGSAGDGGGATAGPAGTGGSLNGLAGLAVVVAAGTASNSLSEGIGGGAAFIAGGSATLDNTTISSNRASTSNNDVYGTFSS